MLLSTAYFPPVEYFAAIASADEVYVEACENYQKQSYRNRCVILAADGPASLNVPVVHENGTYELPIRDIRIDYSTAWLIRTERAIDSAYKSSAFFDYYRDGVFAILDSKPEKLFDLNMALTGHFLLKCGIKADIKVTDTFEPYGFTDVYGEDLRSAIHPKRPNCILQRFGLEKPYYQVFFQKHGFVPNLSIMDLLFNEGPDSISYLSQI